MRGQDATQRLPTVIRILKPHCGAVCCGSIGVLCGSVFGDSAVYDSISIEVNM
jgi:hypothetical protein